jgi:hypothetical protein
MKPGIYSRQSYRRKMRRQIIVQLLYLCCILELSRGYTAVRWNHAVTSRYRSEAAEHRGSTKGSFKLWAEERKVISCETTGSCGSTRRAYKQELNRLREEKRKEGVSPEDAGSYVEMLSGGRPDPSTKKSYSPFKKPAPPRDK